MEAYFSSDTKRIKHAHKVTHNAEILLERERGDDSKEVPPIARNILVSLGFEPEQIGEICDIIARHHRPGIVDTLNFQILYDTDWLVNPGEECQVRDRSKLPGVIEKLFLTESGKTIAKELYNAKKPYPELHRYRYLV